MPKRQTYAAKTGEILRSRIQSGDLQAGDLLLEVELSEQLGLSRAPIREALQELMAEGLLETASRNSKMVRRLTPKIIEDSFSLAGILMGAALCDSLPDFLPETFQDLDSVVRQMAHLPWQGARPTEAGMLDADFHQCLMQHCRNHMLIHTAVDACRPISKYLCYKQWTALYEHEEFWQRHQKLVEAARDGDVQVVNGAVRAHYEETGRRLAALYQEAQTRSTSA